MFCLLVGFVLILLEIFVISRASIQLLRYLQIRFTDHTSMALMVVSVTNVYCFKLFHLELHSYKAYYR